MILRLKNVFYADGYFGDALLDGEMMYDLRAIICQLVGLVRMDRMEQLGGWDFSRIAEQCQSTMRWPAPYHRG